MAKITRKSYKRNKIVLGASLFAGVALISTGFAAWVISTSVNKNATGNVEIGITKNNSVDLTLDQAENYYFYFEPVQYNENPTGENYYLFESPAGTPEDPKESLKITITGTIKNISHFDRMEVKMANHDGINMAHEHNYITAPTCYNSAVTYKTSDENSIFTEVTSSEAGESKYYTFSLEIAFSWGTAFENKNPSIYYGNKYYNATTDEQKQNIKKEAIDTLDTLRMDIRQITDLSLSQYQNLSDSEKKAKGTEPKFKVSLTCYAN